MGPVVRRTLLALILCFPFLGMLTQLDDELSTESTELLKNSSPVRASEAYQYHLGIYASAGEDPAELGKLLYEMLEQEDYDGYDSETVHSMKGIELPSGELFCSFHKPNCYKTLFTSEYDINALKLEYKELLQRMETFRNFDEYTTLITSNFIVPRYGFFLKAERLRVLDSISSYRNGYNKEAIASLLKQLEEHRRSFSKQDILIGKMIYTALMHQVIDVASIILGESSENYIGKIPEFSSEEKSFLVIAANEFKLSWKTLTKADKHPEAFKDGANHPPWLIRALFKPHMTLNTSAANFMRLAGLSDLTLTEFALRTANELPQKSEHSLLRNPFSYFADPDMVGFDKYAARIMDIDAKIQLLNQRFHQQQSFASMKNPYDEKKRLRYLANKVCFDTNLTDERSNCLYVSISADVVFVEN